jgi:hypothetical protein
VTFFLICRGFRLRRRLVLALAGRFYTLRIAGLGRPARRLGLDRGWRRPLGSVVLPYQLLEGFLGFIYVNITRYDHCKGAVGKKVDRRPWPELVVITP